MSTLTWTRRHWLVAVGGAVATALVVGVPTAVIPTSVFGRAVPVTWWSYPVLAVVAVLSGLLLATYVREPARPAPTNGQEAPGAPQAPTTSPSSTAPVTPAAPDATAGTLDPGQRRGMIAAALSFFAVGCPVCNKIVLLLLGTSGAMTWFAPLQPLLAVAAVAGLAWALRTRLAGLRSCPVPATVPAGRDRLDRPARARD